MLSDTANNVADAFDVLLEEIEAQIGLTDKAVLRWRIEMADRQIDGLVYELYALTPVESI